MSRSEPPGVRFVDDPPTGSGTDAAARPDPDLFERTFHTARLRLFLRWLLRFVGGFALAQLIAVALRPTWYPIVSASVAVIHTLLLLVARAQLRRGRPLAGAILIAAGFALVALVGSVGVAPAMALYVLLPILSAIVALPFLIQQGLRVMTIASTLATLLIITLALTVDPPFEADPFEKGSLIVAVTAITGLTMLLLEQLHRRLNAILAQTRAANSALEEARGQAHQEFAQRQASEARFRTFIEQSLEGLIITDEHGTVIEWNQAQARLSGWARDEVIGLPLWTVHARMAEPGAPGGCEEHLRGLILSALRADAAPFLGAVQELTIRRRDGTTVTLQQVVFRIKTEQGYGLGSSTRDITERRQIEAERERLIAELERKNAELERFTYTVSHDLKSPLITIGGFASLLERDIRSGNAQQLSARLGQITAAIQKMHRLIDQLLELSQIGKLLQEPEDLPFAEIVQEALSLVQGRLAARAPQVHVAADLPVVRGDRVRLVEVMQNLLDNAAKYLGDQPAPQIWVGTYSQDGTPVLFVRDNGIGIPRQYHQKIFGLFDKLNVAGDGVGIGLALVKQIVESHGGRIWVESEPGQGTTFFFTLAPERAGA